MTKILFRVALLAVLTGFTHAQYKRPTSDNPEDFQREVKEYILSTSEDGVNADGDNPGTRQVIATDPRDWETPLAEIIGAPDKYRTGATESALLIANLRKKGTDPRISAATIQLLQKLVEISIERLDKTPENPRVITGTKARIDSFLAEMVRTDSPEVLQAILVYFNSPEVDRLGTLQLYAPKDVAPALQKYGDMRNVEEAEKVAAKLASIGRADIASDIKRAAERIRKDATRKQAPSNGDAKGPKDAAGNDDLTAAKISTKQLWPWLAAATAFIAALVVYFRKKR